MHHFQITLFKQRKTLRQEHALSIMKEPDIIWMRGQVSEVLPRSATGEAITYTLKLWKRLFQYTVDGRWEIDNTLAGVTEQYQRHASWYRKITSLPGRMKDIQ